MVLKFQVYVFELSCVFRLSAAILKISTLETSNQTAVKEVEIRLLFLWSVIRSRISLKEVMPEFVHPREGVHEGR